MKLGMQLMEKSRLDFFIQFSFFQMTSILRNLSKNMSELQDTCKDQKINPLFPSSLDFDGLITKENTFTECLQAYIQKQFFPVKS